MPSDYSQLLPLWMQRAGIPNYKALSQQSGVSEKQIRRLRRGEIAQMRLETFSKLSQALQIPLTELLQQASAPESLAAPKASQSAELESLKQEYQRLESQLAQQRQSLWQEFQQTSLQALESWLLQWPTAAYAAQQNPQAPAVKLLPLLRPVEQLVQQWGIEAIATVGQEIPYDPQWHQLMEGTAQTGDRVRVRYTGYRQGDRLLYRAKVSPAGSPSG